MVLILCINEWFFFSLFNLENIYNPPYVNNALYDERTLIKRASSEATSDKTQGVIIWKDQGANFFWDEE